MGWKPPPAVVGSSPLQGNNRGLASKLATDNCSDRCWMGRGQLLMIGDRLGGERGYDRWPGKKYGKHQVRGSCHNEQGWFAPFWEIVFQVEGLSWMSIRLLGCVDKIIIYTNWGSLITILNSKRGFKMDNSGAKRPVKPKRCANTSIVHRPDDDDDDWWPWECQLLSSAKNLGFTLFPEWLPMHWF